MATTTPYSKDLGDREPIATIRQNIERIRAIATSFSPEQYELSYAPGKWTARQILTHLGHSEMALGNRARMALTTPDYLAQAFDQDKWMAHETGLGGRDAGEAFLAMARMNLLLFNSLSPENRRIAMRHPEYGTITVDWILHTIAGHQVHHLTQLEQIESLVARG